MEKGKKTKMKKGIGRRNGRKERRGRRSKGKKERRDRKPSDETQE